MANKSKEFSPEEIKRFEAFSVKVTHARFAKKCEYPDGEAPEIKSPEEAKKDPEYKEL